MFLVLQACRSGPVNPPVPAGCGLGTPFIREQLYFGRGLPGGGEVSDSAWAGFLATEVTPRFPDGITVVDARGQWKGASGEVVRERTWLLVLYHPASEDADQRVTAVISVYRQRFAQEAVLRERTATCVTLRDDDGGDARFDHERAAVFR
jgi:hypothetical protein